MDFAIKILFLFVVDHIHCARIDSELGVLSEDLADLADLFPESRLGDSRVHDPRLILAEPRVARENGTVERDSNECAITVISPGETVELQFDSVIASSVINNLVYLKENEKECHSLISEGNDVSLECSINVYLGRVRVRTNDRDNRRSSCTRRKSPCKLSADRENDLRLTLKSTRRRSTVFTIQCNATSSDDSDPTTSPDEPPTSTNEPPSTDEPPTSTDEPPSTEPTPEPSECKCGTRFTNRIVGGRDAAIGEFPWAVRLAIFSAVFNTTLLCGGSIIDDKHILTAAHCAIEAQNPEDVTVFVNDYNRLVEDGEVPFSVSSVLVHPDYNLNTQDNDFGILTLNAKIDFSGTEYMAKPICLPVNQLSSDPFVNTSSTAVGWGEVVYRGELADVLQAVNVTTVTNERCNELYFGGITSNMICARDPGKDACRGDSGGPLSTRIQGQSYVIGLSSFGEECAREEYPGVYSRVTSQLSWILENSGGEDCDPRR